MPFAYHVRELLPLGAVCKDERSARCLATVKGECMEDQTAHLYRYTDPYGNGFELAFAKGAYALGGGLHVEAWCVEDGFAEPYADVTVNLPATLPGATAFLDADLPSGFAAWLELIGAGRATGRATRSGLGGYAEFAFSGPWRAEIPGEYGPSSNAGLALIG